MNANEIDALIEQIEHLQVTVNQTRRELTRIRNRVDDNNNAEVPEPRPAAGQGGREEQDPNRELRVGDQVELLNAVRLRGAIRSSRGVIGTVDRFTNTYVIVRVELTNTRRNSVAQYQEIRRAPHNLGLILNHRN